MSSSRHFCVLHQLEISREHTLGWIQGWQLAGKGSERCGYVHTSREIGIFVHSAAVKPHGSGYRVRDQVNHDIREHLVFREDGLSLVWRIAPELQLFGNPRCRAKRVVRE